MQNSKTTNKAKTFTFVSPYYLEKPRLKIDWLANPDIDTCNHITNASKNTI